MTITDIKHKKIKPLCVTSKEVYLKEIRGVKYPYCKAHGSLKNEKKYWKCPKCTNGCSVEYEK